MNEQDMKIYLVMQSLKVSVDHACRMYKEGASVGVNIVLGQLVDKIIYIQSLIKEERG